MHTRAKPDSNGKSCNNADIAGADSNGKSFNKEDSPRLNEKTKYKVTLKRKTASELVQTMGMDEFLQFHAKAGLKPVPILQAITIPKPDELSDPSDEELKVGYTKFMQELVEIGNTKPDSFEPGDLRNAVHKHMRSPKIRAQTVKDLAKNGIKSARAVQSLMHAIGSAGTTQPEAIDQLIELAGTSGIDEAAALQSVVALVQAKCYNHDHAIRGLTKLARPDAHTHTQITALHVQHGLIGHADHCANHKYTDAFAHKYDDILAATHKHLEAAVANGDDAAALVLVDAIGNTQSQRLQETAALAAVANSGHLGMKTRLLAVENLGRLFTPQALVALKRLATHPTYTGTALQESCERAISGDRLAKGDVRRLQTESPATLTQVSTQRRTKDQNPKGTRDETYTDAETKKEGGLDISFKREKVWTFPSNPESQLRAEPKVGGMISYEDKVPCLQGYAGVEGKAWSWTVSLVAAGVDKCGSEPLETHISVLSIKVWNREFGKRNRKKSKNKKTGRDVIRDGQVISNAPQFATSGDQQGYCGTNVDLMDIVAVFKYDRDFLVVEKTWCAGPCCITGTIRITGEVGIKAGWGEMVTDTTRGTWSKESWKTSPPPPKCDKGKLLFGIPYIQATVSGELSLDALLFRVGGGINVILVKLSLPVTMESGKDGDKDWSCGGTYLKVETMGGKIYVYVESISGVKSCATWASPWCIERTWKKEYELVIFEWSSPAVWSTNELNCNVGGVLTTTAVVTGKATPAPTPSPIPHIDADWYTNNCVVDNPRYGSCRRRRSEQNPDISEGMKILLRASGGPNSGKWFLSDSKEGMGYSWLYEPEANWWKPKSKAPHRNLNWKLHFKGNRLVKGTEVYLKSETTGKWLCSNMNSGKGLSWSSPIFEFCQPGKPAHSWRMWWFQEGDLRVRENTGTVKYKGTNVWLESTSTVDGKTWCEKKCLSHYLSSSPGEGSRAQWLYRKKFPTFSIYFANLDMP